MGVDVMKDYKLKLRNLRVSHTLGWSYVWANCPNGEKKKIYLKNRRVVCCCHNYP